MPITSSPSLSQWMQTLSRPGSKGGWRASLEPGEHVARAVTGEGIGWATRGAVRDLRSLAYHIKCAPSRKGVP
eukprot:9052390-Alexandrium_andersonii.AAC.1